MAPAKDLSSKIHSKEATVGIVGIGYVGSALGNGASQGGFRVKGLGRGQVNIDKINQRNDPNFTATRDSSILDSCDIICVCVPTPLYKNKSPNLSHFKQALTTVSRHLRPGVLICIESSVAPGTTRNVARPILERSGLTAGKDFFLSFSPERIDPGNKTYGIVNTPKVVSGFDQQSQSLAGAFYATFIRTIVPVSSLEVAELTKFFENVFRFVNISLVNELSHYARRLDISMWEVIDAASTKPFGFLPHYPGPGIGGDCIPVLPAHLLASARALNVTLPIVTAATKVNDRQPRRVVRDTLAIINSKRVKQNGKPHVLLVGLSYKPETSDTRQSPSLAIWKLLEKAGVAVSYHDPYVPHYNGARSVELNPESIQSHDAVIIGTHHAAIPYDAIAAAQTPIIDTRNVLSRHRQPHIVRL